MIYCQPDLKITSKAMDPSWFWHGILKQWIPNLSDQIAECAYADEIRNQEYFIHSRYFRALGGAPANVEPLFPAIRALCDTSRSEEIYATAAERGRKGESILETVQRAVETHIKDHEAEVARQELAVEAAKRPVEAISSEMDREWQQSLERFQAYGYQAYGPKGVCIYTGLPADSVDHAPSWSYVEAHGGPRYGGRKLLVACNATANAHKADYGSECLWQCAERIAYRASVAQKDAKKAAGIINGVQATWPRKEYPCSCARCEGVDSETRRKRIMDDPKTTQPVVRTRK